MNAILGVQREANSGAPTAQVLLASGPAGVVAEHTWEEGLISLAGTGPQVTLEVGPDLVVLVDGRLDDDGSGSVTGTPSQRIADAFRRWGEDFLDHVVGDVSGVVVDRVAGSLLAFRDLVGTRPLHLAQGQGAHGVATDVRHLVGPQALLPGRLNETWAAHFLDASYPPPRLSPYAGVALVQPGHVAQPRGPSWLMRRRAAWRLSPERRTPAGHAEALRAALDEAVRCRLVGVRRAGVELSGGMDSTTVLACARAVRPDLELTALAIPFTDPAGDERELQELVARHCSARLSWVSLDGYGPFGESPSQVVRQLGQPPQVPNWFFHSAARDVSLSQGLEVVLTGEDGDGLLAGGPAVLAHLLTTGRLLSFLREGLAVRRTSGVGARRLVRRSLEAARWMQPQPGPSIPSLVPPEFSRPSARSATGPVRPGRFWPEHVRAYLDSHYLPWIAHAAGQQWGALPRGSAHPFLDRRVVELCLAMPPSQRLSDGLGKAVLRRAMADRLPAAVLERAVKARLSAPFEEAMSSAHGSRTRSEGLETARQRSWPWLSTDGWGALRALPTSTERDFAEYRAVMASTFATFVERSATGVSAPTQAPLVLQERG